MVRKIFISLFIGLMLCILPGCATKIFKNTPPELKIVLKTDDKLNPNIDNEPTAVSVQIIQLTSDEVFTKALFIDLYNDSIGVLGSSYISGKLITSVNPSSTEELNIRLNENTAFIGVVVGFSQYDNNNGKAIIPIKDSSEDNQLELQINGIRIELKKKED
jgi:type VI secretion system protein VasD